MQPARQINRMIELKYILPTYNWFKPMLIELQLTHSKKKPLRVQLSFLTWSRRDYTNMNSIFDPPLTENTSMTTYWGGIAGCAKSLGVCHAANAADAPIVLICESYEKDEHFLR